LAGPRLSIGMRSTIGVALIAGVTVALLARPPLWLLLLLGSIALAMLYLIARFRSRYDPLDPRFGSCIPPISGPRDPPA
jgi:hypothetical protein